MSFFDPEEAADRVSQLGLVENQILAHGVRLDILGLPAPGEVNSFEEAERARLEAVKRWAAVQDVLLRTHKLAFASVPGVGHRRVPVAEQVEWARAQGLREARAALDKAEARATHVDVGRLSDAQRKERTDALNRLAEQRRALGGRRQRLW